VETLINTVECPVRPQIIRFTTITIGVNLGGTMNPAMLKNAGVIDPVDPVGVKKALGEAEEVVGAEGKSFLFFFFFYRFFVRILYHLLFCLYNFGSFNLFTDSALKAHYERIKKIFSLSSIKPKFDNKVVLIFTLNFYDNMANLKNVKKRTKQFEYSSSI
jgi:hypothetical protein